MENSLPKDLEDILKETDPELHDYEELQYIWEQWRNNSGRLMRDLYNDYLDLENEAALLNGNVDFKYRRVCVEGKRATRC